MGVRGLVGLVNHHGDIYSDHKLSNTRVVVDGHNLLHLMYCKAGLDQNHGGDYATYEALIESFVRTLKDCGVEPYVLLDGGFNRSDRTLKKQRRESETQAKKAQEASRQTSFGPMMAKPVFTQTLARLEVPLAQCFGGADREIATLARDWDVPVLSNDSDFYIFDLPAGVLPFYHFQWQAAAAAGARTGSSPTYIKCKKYNSSYFCTSFCIKEGLLPAFAVLAGNENAMENIKRMTNVMSTSNTHYVNRPDSDMRLINLLGWLRRFKTPLEAFKEASSGNEMDNLMRGLQEYQILPSSLDNFFVKNVVPSFPSANFLPDWMRQPLTEARLPNVVLDVLQRKRKDLSILVVEGSLPSAHETSRPLRQAMYGLLLGRNATVYETDRVSHELQDIPVSATKTRAAEGLTLISLWQAEESQRLWVLQEALDLNDNTWASVRRLEDQLRLPLAVTCYWFQQAQPKPHQHVLRALLLLLSLKDRPQTCRALRGKMTPLTGRPDAAVVHALNQWLCCMKDSIQLNQLLGWPLPEPCVARLFEGTLLHQMIRELKASRQPRSLITCTAVREDLYKRLMATVRQSAPQRPQTLRAPPADDLVCRLFVTCWTEDEEEEESMEQEVDHCHFLRLKNRFMTKERSNRRSNLDLIRKQDLRGRDLV